MRCNSATSALTAPADSSTERFKPKFPLRRKLTSLVRSWTSWHRWTILALLAHAFLSVLAAAQPDHSQPPE
jgi:hypothetical protein